MQHFKMIHDIILEYGYEFGCERKDDLMVSEINHYTILLKFVRKYSTDADVDKRWNEWLEFEGDLIQSFGNKEAIHGETKFETRDSH